LDDIRRRLQSEAERQRAEVKELEAKANELAGLADKLRRRAQANKLIADAFDRALSTIDETLKQVPADVLEAEGQELLGEAEAAIATGIAELTASEQGKREEAGGGDGEKEEADSSQYVKGVRVPFVIGEGSSAVRLADFFTNTKKGVLVAEFSINIGNDSNVMKVVVENLLAPLKVKQGAEYDVVYDEKMEAIKKITVSGLRPEQVGMVVEKLKYALNSDYKASVRQKET